MPISYTIALIITSLCFLREYILKTRIYDYAFFIAGCLSWIGIVFPTTYFYIFSILAIIIVLVVSKFLWGNTYNANKNSIKNNISGNTENYLPFLKDSIGKVTSDFKNGSYLGSIIKDGQINEIIIYSDEQLQKGDTFKILGIFSGKIKAIKN